MTGRETCCCSVRQAGEKISIANVRQTLVDTETVDGRWRDKQWEKQRQLDGK